MSIAKTAMLANLTGKPYIRLASTALSITEKTAIAAELAANWYSLDIAAEKWNIGKSATSESFYASDDLNYETQKEFTGDGVMVSVDKTIADYVSDTFHNKAVDICFYNSASARMAVVYNVVAQVNVDLKTQDKAMLTISYKVKGDATTLKANWNIIEMVTVSNPPLIETVQAEDDGSGTLGLVANITSVGTTAGGAAGTISACGWCMLKQADGTLPLPVLTDGATASTRTATGYLSEAGVTAAAGRWQVRAWATNTAGTSYGKIISVTTT